MQLNALELFDKKWALLTAGTAERYNTMTISWGAMGTLWNKPVVTVYVRPTRYTFGFMENSDVFTVSFYPEAYRKDLGVLGSLSGRDGDKVKKTRLTPKALDKGMTFEQAERTLVCRKLYAQDLARDSMPEDVAKTFYQEDAPHRMYIGEVLEVL